MQGVNGDLKLIGNCFNICLVSWKLICVHFSSFFSPHLIPSHTHSSYSVLLLLSFLLLSFFFLLVLLLVLLFPLPPPPPLIPFSPLLSPIRPPPPPVTTPPPSLFPPSLPHPSPTPPSPLLLRLQVPQWGAPVHTAY